MFRLAQSLLSVCLSMSTVGTASEDPFPKSSKGILQKLEEEAVVSTIGAGVTTGAGVLTSFSPLILSSLFAAKISAVKKEKLERKARILTVINQFRVSNKQFSEAELELKLIVSAHRRMIAGENQKVISDEEVLDSLEQELYQLFNRELTSLEQTKSD